MSCGVGCRGGSNLALLWLWHTLAAAALIYPLAWEPLHAMGAALTRQKKKKKESGAYIDKRHKVVNTSLKRAMIDSEAS